jgi:hypothetical protein
MLSGRRGTGRQNEYGKQTAEKQRVISQGYDSKASWIFNDF